MKTKRFLLAAVILASVAACSGEVTAPDASLRAGANASVAPDATTSSTTTPTVTEPEPVKDEDGGLVGSGVGR